MIIELIIHSIIALAVINLYWADQPDIDKIKENIKVLEHDLTIVVNKLDKIEKDLNLFMANMRELVHRYGNSRYK